MILRDRLKDHPKTIFRIGMLCLLIGSLVPLFPQPTSDFWLGLVHGARISLFGASIGLSLWARKLTDHQRNGHS